MTNQLNLAMFDHRQHDEMIEFITELTAAKPMCIGMADDECDTYVLVYGEKPFSQDEAESFFKTQIPT